MPAAEPRPGPTLIPLPLGEVDEVPDDQEVVGEAHLPDRLQLEAEPFAQRRRRPCRSASAGPSRRARRGSRTRRGRSATGNFGSRIRPSSISTLQRSATSSVRRSASAWPGKSPRHLLRRLEVEVVGLELPVVRVLQRVARLDAEQRLVRARVLVAEVVDIAGRDRREPGRGGELGELRQDPRLDVEVGVLELDVDVVAAEYLREPVELGSRRRRAGSPRAPCRRGPRGSPRARSRPAECRSSSSQSTRGL